MNKPSILVVEDNADARAFLNLVLSELGYEIHYAEDGNVGFKILSDLRPSLVILDIQMPNCDGFKFREMQLANPLLAHIPVILNSAYNDVGKAAKELQIRFYLKQKFHKQELLAVVKQALLGRI